MDSETRTFIKKEIERQMNIILSALTGESVDVATEKIDQLFPGMPPTDGRPVMHPYGFASRALAGIVNVTARSGEHVGNRMILGHRDKDRPSDLEVGESVIYSNGGLKIYLRNGKIQIGSENSDNPAVLYNEIKILLELILDHVIAHTHIGNLGFLTGAPQNVADFETDKEKIDTIKSGKTFLEK